MTEQPEPAQQTKESVPKHLDYFKLFLAGVALAVVIGGAYVYLAKQPSSNLPQLPAAGLAAYNPQHLLAGWHLTSSESNLAQIEPALRTEMMSQGVIDAAVWEFSKDSNKLYFWTRIYKDEQTRANYDYVFNGPLAWRNGLRANVAIGDEGIVGIYRTKGNDPLMVYVAKGAQVWYISYYNYVNENGPAYNATNIDADKRFLINLGKEFYSSFQNSSQMLGS